MNQEKWKSYLESQEVKINKMQEKLRTAQAIYQNVVNTSSLSDRELGLSASRDKYIYYTSSNKDILKKDRVYSKLEDLRSFIGQHTSDYEYLVPFKIIDKLQDKMADRTMEKKQYHFIRKNSLEVLAEEILGKKFQIVQQ